MKKALALVLALVFALSLSTMAFATDAEDINISDVSSAVEEIVDFSEGLNIDTDIFSTIEDAAVNALEAVSNIDLTAFNSDSIANILDTFKDCLADVGIDTSSSTLKDLFNNLKQKIKDLYCGSVAELPEAEEEEEAPETGSSATGIVAFAAVSVAAAAAFVCTKKKVA